MTPRFPAEFEPHAATWIAWPHHEPDWPGNRDFLMFERWFAVDYGSIVIDLCEEPPAWEFDEVIN